MKLDVKKYNVTCDICEMLKWKDKRSCFGPVDSLQLSKQVVSTVRTVKLEGLTKVAKCAATC